MSHERFADTTPSGSFAATWLSRHEGALCLFLCLLAATRVFVFSAAFPFFSNIDEDRHFDLVMRYAHGEIPRSYDVLEKESLDLIVRYGSPEFLLTPQFFPDGKFPSPLWKQSADEAEPALRATEDVWKNELNFEASQPPLYYILAAAWTWLGRLIGLSGLQFLYWIRFLNVPLQALLVWLGFVAARLIFPDQTNIRIGVPMLLAFVPQDIFYSIQNDVLSPICFALLFICFLRWSRDDPPSLVLAALTGLAAALTFLAKLTNLPMLSVVFAAITARCCLSGRDRRAWIALATFGICAGLPIATWITWTKYNFGDLTGSAAKMAMLGWTRKSLPEWWSHPIFSLKGAWEFLSELLASFWRGEFSWQHQTLRSPITDFFYVASSLLFLGTAVAAVRRSGVAPFQRNAVWIAAFTVLGPILFLGFLSIQFDFGPCPNPSRAHPYFTSGRLMSGALVPFAILYVYGLQSLFGRSQRSNLPAMVLAVIVASITVSEIVVNRVAFRSEHNWFHG